MSEKCIDLTASGNEEYTDRPVALNATVDFLAPGDVYFTLRERELDDDLAELIDPPLISQFYIPVAQARALAEFILKETAASA